MKTMFYVFMALMSIVCAICALIILGYGKLDDFPFLAMVLLEIASLANLYLFVYKLHQKVKEDKMYDLAAKQQLEYDWLYYEALMDYVQAHVNSRED